MPSCSTWRRHFTGASHKTLRLVQVMKELPDVYAPPHIDLIRGPCFQPVGTAYGLRWSSEAHFAEGEQRILDLAVCVSQVNTGASSTKSIVSTATFLMRLRGRSLLPALHSRVAVGCSRM